MELLGSLPLLPNSSRLRKDGMQSHKTSPHKNKSTRHYSCSFSPFSEVDAYISRPKKLFRRNCKVVWNSVWLACFAVYLENAQKYTCHGFSSLSEAAKTIVSYSDSKKSWYMLYVIKGNPDLLTLWNIPWVALTGIKKCYCELK